MLRSVADHTLDGVLLAKISPSAALHAEARLLEAALVEAPLLAQVHHSLAGVSRAKRSLAAAWHAEKCSFEAGFTGALLGVQVHHALRSVLRAESSFPGSGLAEARPFEAVLVAAPCAGNILHVFRRVGGAELTLVAALHSEGRCFRAGFAGESLPAGRHLLSPSSQLRGEEAQNITKATYCDNKVLLSGSVRPLADAGRRSTSSDHGRGSCCAGIPGMPPISDLVDTALEGGLPGSAQQTNGTTGELIGHVMAWHELARNGTVSYSMVWQGMA